MSSGGYIYHCTLNTTECLSILTLLASITETLEPERRAGVFIHSGHEEPPAVPGAGTISRQTICTFKVGASWRQLIEEGALDRLFDAIQQLIAGHLKGEDFMPHQIFDHLQINWFSVAFGLLLSAIGILSGAGEAMLGIQIALFAGCMACCVVSNEGCKAVRPTGHCVTSRGETGDAASW